METDDVTKSRAEKLEYSKIGREFTWPELCHIAGFMTYRHMDEGDLLFKEGDPGVFMALITEGTLSVVKDGPQGGLVLVGDIHARQLVGEQAIIDGEPRSASVYAKTACDLLMLSRSAFFTIIEEDHTIGAKLMTALAKVVSARLRMMTGRLVREGNLESFSAAR